MNGTARMIVGTAATFVAALALAMGIAVIAGATLASGSGIGAYWNVPPLAQAASIAALVIAVVAGMSLTTWWAERAI